LECIPSQWSNGSCSSSTKIKTIMKVEPKKIILMQKDIEDAIKIWLLSKLDNEREEVVKLCMRAFEINSGISLGDCTVNYTIDIVEKVKK
jgi:hypothetical protein